MIVKEKIIFFSIDSWIAPCLHRRRIFHWPKLFTWSYSGVFLSFSLCLTVRRRSSTTLSSNKGVLGGSGVRSGFPPTEIGERPALFPWSTRPGCVFWMLLIPPINLVFLAPKSISYLQGRISSTKSTLFGCCQKLTCMCLWCRFHHKLQCTFIEISIFFQKINKFYVVIENLSKPFPRNGRFQVCFLHLHLEWCLARADFLVSELESSYPPTRTFTSAHFDGVDPHRLCPFQALLAKRKGSAIYKQDLFRCGQPYCQSFAGNLLWKNQLISTLL